jgi:hypothetical protein
MFEPRAALRQVSSVYRFPFPIIHSINSSTVIIIYYSRLVQYAKTASVVYWSEFLTAEEEVSGSIPGTTRYSE